MICGWTIIKYGMWWLPLPAPSAGPTPPGPLRPVSWWGWSELHSLCLKAAQFSLVAQLCPTLCNPMTAARQASLSFIISNSRPLSRWCHPTISSFVVPFSSCLHSFPASGSFPVSQFFPSGGVSASASVLPMNIQDWFPLGLTGLISLQSKGLSRVFSSTKFESRNTSALILLHGLTLMSIHDYWKNHTFD